MVGHFRRGLGLGFLLCAGACATTAKSAPQQLYFAVEVSRQGKVVATPKLLGEAGVPLRAERRQPGARFADYQLLLEPKDTGHGYRIKLDLATPDSSGHSELSLLHGEERKVELGRAPGDLQISLMVMRVDSPEFRALFDLSAPRAGPGSI